MQRNICYQRNSLSLECMMFQHPVQRTHVVKLLNSRDHPHWMNEQVKNKIGRESNHKLFESSQTKTKSHQTRRKISNYITQRNLDKKTNQPSSCHDLKFKQLGSYHGHSFCDLLKLFDDFYPTHLDVRHCIERKNMRNSGSEIKAPRKDKNSMVEFAQVVYIPCCLKVEFAQVVYIPCCLPT